MKKVLKQSKITLSTPTDRREDIFLYITIKFCLQSLKYLDNEKLNFFHFNIYTLEATRWIG